MNDALVICTADSERQVQAVKDNIDKVLDEKGYRILGIEGAEVGSWVLMDYDDVVVHIFKRGVRETYGLDKIWSDARRVALPRDESSATVKAHATAGPIHVHKERSLKQRG